MTYKDVVREMFANNKGVPASHVMKMAAAEWNRQKAGGQSASKSKSRKGGNMISDMNAMLAPLRGGNMFMPAANGSAVYSGGGIDSDNEEGAGLFGDLGHGVDSLTGLFGLGLKKPSRRLKYGAGVSAGDLDGAGLFGDLGHGVDSISELFGLGLTKPQKATGKLGMYNMPIGSSSSRPAYGGDQSKVFGNLRNRKNRSSAIEDSGAGVSAGNFGIDSVPYASAGSLMDGLKFLPFLSML